MVGLQYDKTVTQVENNKQKQTKKYNNEIWNMKKYTMQWTVTNLKLVTHGQ